MIGGDAGAVSGTQQEWEVAAVVGHRRAEGGRLEFLVQWCPTCRTVHGGMRETWEVEKVERLGDSGLELVYWRDTWEPVSSLEDADGVQAEAYVRYCEAHPGLTWC